MFHEQSVGPWKGEKKREREKGRERGERTIEKSRMPEKRRENILVDDNIVILIISYKFYSNMIITKVCFIW